MTCWHRAELREDRTLNEEPRNFSRLKNVNGPNTFQGEGTNSSRMNSDRQVCKAKLFPSAIHMLIDRQSTRDRQRATNAMGENNDNKREGTGEILPSHNNALGDLLVSGIPANNFDGLDT